MNCRILALILGPAAILLLASATLAEGPGLLGVGQHQWFRRSPNVGIDHLIEFDGYLYAGTWNDVDRGEVWRAGNGTDWSEVVSGGFGDATNAEAFSFAVLSDTLQASTWSYTYTHGTEIYTTTNGISWIRAISNGFGHADNRAALSWEEFDGHLYASTRNSNSGGEA